MIEANVVGQQASGIPLPPAPLRVHIADAIIRFVAWAFRIDAIAVGLKFTGQLTVEVSRGAIVRGNTFLSPFESQAIVENCTFTGDTGDISVKF